MAINFGKGKETLFASTDLMSFGKAFSRMAAQPLDMYEVWYDYDELVAYAANTDSATATAYVGQKVVYIDTNNKVTHYSIEADGSLKELGTTPVGDEDSIVVDENGTISLKGVDSLVFEREVEGETVEVKFQPLMTKDGLVWVEPSKTTVEGLAVLIEELTGRVGALETKVGKAAEGENAATGLFKAIADEVARADAAEKALGERIDAIDFVDSDELATELAPYAKTADLAPYAKTADVVSKTDYAVDKKALEDKDIELAAAAKEAKDAADAAQKAIDDFLVGTGAEEVIDTLTDIKEALDSLTDPTELAQAIAGKADKTELANYVTNDTYNAHITTQGEVDAAQDQALIDYKAEMVTALAGKQNVIADNTYDAYGSAATAEQNAKDYADTELAKKVDKVDGYGLLSEADQAKLDKLTLDGDDLTISGSVEAGSVKNLDTWLTTNRDKVAGLYPTADATKLSNIAAGAQVNVIEGVKVNNVDLTVTDKKVNIDLTPYATVTALNGVSERAELGVTNAATAQSKANSAYDIASANKTTLETISPIVSGHTTTIGEQGGKISALETKVATLEPKVATLESNVGTNTGDITTLKTTVSGHSTKLGEIDVALENIRTDIGANSASVVTLKNQLKGIETTEGSVLTLINAAHKAGIDAQSTANDAVAGVNTNAGNIAKLDGRLTSLEESNNGVSNTIMAHGSRITILEGTVESQGNLLNTTVERVTTLESQITGLTGAMHFRGISSTDPMAEAGPTIEGIESYASGDVVIFSGKEYVYDGSVWHLFGDEGSYALKDSVYTKTEIDGKVSTINQAIADAEGRATAAASQALTDAKAYVDAAMTWQEMPELA